MNSLSKSFDAVELMSPHRNNLNMRCSLSATRFSIGAAALFIAAPAIIFYSILMRHVVKAPIADDYYALLDFSNHIREAPNLPAKSHYFLISQYNQYKLFFEHALFWLQLELWGHLDLAVLCILGDSFVLWLAILLWKMFSPRDTEFNARLTFFVPIPWLLFQLQYAQTLNFAMAALQNLPVLLFSLAAIYLLFRRTRWTFLWSLVCLVLAVSSSANGLLMIPIGVLALALSHKIARLAVWAATSAVCISAYSLGYSATLWLTPSNSFFPSRAPFWHARYLLCFVGSAGGYPIRSGSLVLGIAICVFFGYVTRRGYFRRNPSIGYSVLFLLLTSVGVAAFRSESGVPCNSSRYTIYSALLLIFAWFVIVDEWLTQKHRSSRQRAVFLSAVVAAVLFSVSMDVWGLRYLVSRNRDLVTGVALYERNPSPQSSAGPAFPPPNTMQAKAFNRQARDILAQSAKLGIYRLPAY